VKLHIGEMEDIKAEIEAGADVREIVRTWRDRQHPAAADRPAVGELEALRGMVLERLARVVGGEEPWPGPLLMPRGVDFGQVDMYLYIWAAILLGITLAQNAVDGSPAAAGRPIPDQFAFWDAAFPAFWDGDADDDRNAPAPVGDWPAVVTASQASLRADAA
jgi:hypothetical protein